VRRWIKRNAAVSPRWPKTAIGFAASMLALWCQIFLLATISLPPLATGADPVGNVPVCHTDEGTRPAQQTPGHPAHDCAPCVLCISHALPLALLPPTPTMPDQRLGIIDRHNIPYPRAPPARLVAAAQPRGPPSLI
jgi:hypothetical protein